MPSKKMSIEDLAGIMQAGFEKVTTETDKKIDDLAIMVQQGFEETATKADIERLEQRLDRIENILIAGHDRRIEKLEDTVRQLVTAAKLK